jgi:Icc-related predicted phosphoesterase
VPASTLTLVLLSDTHGLHRRLPHSIPEGDVLIHAGDFCAHGRAEEAHDFAAWLGSLPHPHKLVTAGNHDRAIEQDPAAFRAAFAAHGIHLLINDVIDIEGFRFFGSPYTPTFYDWHFMRDRGPALRSEWAKIPEQTDVVITHGPAYGHGDLAPPWRDEPARHVGCFELLLRLRAIRPRLHVFGHIHAGYGVTVSDELPGTTFINAALCTEAYQPTNRPQRFELSRQ